MKSIKDFSNKNVQIFKQAIRDIKELKTIMALNKYNKEFLLNKDYDISIQDGDDAKDGDTIIINFKSLMCILELVDGKCRLLETIDVWDDDNYMLLWENTTEEELKELVKIYDDLNGEVI